MNELTGLSISFIVIIGLNLLAAILVWVEFSSNGFRYLKQVAIGQCMLLLWHLTAIVFTFYPDSRLLFSLSTATAFGAGFYLLAGALHDRTPPDRQLHAIAAAFLALVVTGSILPPPLLEYFWLLIYMVFLAQPIATLLCCRYGSKWLIAPLQTLVAGTFIASTLLLGDGEAIEAGSFLYFIFAILVPLLTLTYIITSVRLSRMQIADKERDYRMFFDAINEVFFRLDSYGTVLTISPSISQFGARAEAVIGLDLAECLESRQAYWGKLQNAALDQKPFEFVDTFRSPTGVRTDCEILCTPFMDTSSGKLHFAGTIRNIQERNELEKQFLDAQRHESLGILAGGVAHDFNNILQGVVGHAELLRRTQHVDAELLEERLGAILRAADSAGNLCRELLLFTGRGLEEAKEFDLRDSLAEVVDILRPSCPADVTLDVTLPTMPALIHGARAQIGQIFLNLIRNAMDAVGESGAISVTARELQVDRSAIEEFALLDRLAEGDYLQVTVRDTGSGIDASIQARIFEPFFTTKPGGHGLGLSAISGILRAHHGTIAVASEPDSGAEFSVWLPARFAERPAPVSPAPPVSDKPKRILLVDDDSEVRNVAAAMLEFAGHQVRSADNGVEALRWYEQDPASVDLLITDIKMPEMDGVTLARRIHARDPDLPIILISGNADTSVELSGEEYLRFQFVQKPYREQELLRLVGVCAEQE